ncbi:sensor histidine kinase [Tepidibacter hydrothermalis]|uniref:histidine kinase n=1 Tax=Tepidibacter hydrothermalis TaxID=3036126 RepID=A0ABY8EIS4_9FIRM|nr:HAMP domain-containing sensor histidine kinase [Tepidibacter hydrothermalis]WFD11804.1 HAMP domain-containing sensor histidine kinase [Tepidibacter hydrothermalis]
MKIKSLNFRLIISFGVIICVFSLIIFLLLIRAFNNYYYEDIYRTLEENEAIIKTTNINDFIKNKDQDIRKIEEKVWLKKEDNVLVRKFNDNISFITEEILVKVEEDIKKQNEVSKRYVMDVDDRELFYVIKRYQDLFGKKTSNGYCYYKVTFKWKVEDYTLEKRLFKQIAISFILAIIMMFLVAFYLSRYLTKPIMKLEKNVKYITDRKLNIPIKMSRDDEIGFLASSIEKMRKELLRYDEDQKFKLHAISHELKTPIMIIKSYLEAVKKGLYPKGTLDASLEVINEECTRLEKLVYNLLYIQRLDYLDSEIKNRKKVNLKEIVQEVIKSYSVQLKQLDIQLDSEDVVIYSDDRQLKTIVENIIDNQIRYAKTLIKIYLKEDSKKIYLNFFNDGECIENIEDIFDLFKKGKKGQSGVGLYIVKRLLKMYNGKIGASNIEGGVYFKIEIEKY